LRNPLARAQSLRKHPRSNRNVSARHPESTTPQEEGMGAISVLIGVLIIVVVGAICFWAIDRFAPDGRLANLLKLLVVLVCLGAIVQRLLALIY
jgi:hypothetical protein